MKVFGRQGSVGRNIQVHGLAKNGVSVNAEASASLQEVWRELRRTVSCRLVDNLHIMLPYVRFSSQVLRRFHNALPFQTCGSRHRYIIPKPSLVSSSSFRLHSSNIEEWREQGYL